MKKQGQTAEQITAALRQRILDWKYPPDYSLNEGVLSQEFNVSRSPVREALRGLEADGLVSRIPNRGYFVRQVNPGEVADLYNVRLALELYAVEELARNTALHDNVRQLEKEWRSLQGGPPPVDAVELARMDERFHLGLALSTGNSMLHEYLARVSERLFVFRTMDFRTVLETNSLDESCRGHLNITEKILTADVTAAREALQANLELGRSNVYSAMGSILTSAFYTP